MSKYVQFDNLLTMYHLWDNLEDWTICHADRRELRVEWREGKFEKEEIEKKIIYLKFLNCKCNYGN